MIKCKNAESLVAVTHTHTHRHFYRPKLEKNFICSRRRMCTKGWISSELYRCIHSACNLFSRLNINNFTRKRKESLNTQKIENIFIGFINNVKKYKLNYI